ncbi:MAG: hypothetical protein NTW50_00515 [Candidatus Berkelbacteria bacterium]|nr:hypothetical protein [Candidatus Berkelbacteria bacterium]
MMTDEDKQDKRTSAQRQKDEMSRSGLIHTGEECTLADFHGWIDATYTGAGYTANFGPAYEADGETEKPGLIQVYYN